MTHVSSPSLRPRPYQKTGVFGLKRRLKERGIKALDGRSTAARAIKEWRAAVESDLGGVDALSRQQQTILHMAAAAVFLLGQIDAWIGARPELIVNGRKRTLAPVVKERTAVADHLARLLGLLGLERRAREVPSLQGYLAAKGATRQEPPGATDASATTRASSDSRRVAQRGAGEAGESGGEA